MKKSLVIILFLILPLAGFAQQDVVSNNDTELIETVKTENEDAKAISISAEVKAKVLKMNRKKSNEIISIKAYRRSLQLKVKTIKLC